MEPSSGKFLRGLGLCLALAIICFVVLAVLVGGFMATAEFFFRYFSS